MWSFLEEKKVAQEAIRQSQRIEQADAFLDNNPQFQIRFEALTERYPQLPAELLMPMAQETNTPVDSQGFQDIVDEYVKLQVTQQANDYKNIKEQHHYKPYSDDMYNNYFSTTSGKEDDRYPVQEYFDERKKDIRTFFTPVRTFTLWTMALAEGLSETLVKYTPHFIGKYENDQIKYNKETGEWDLLEGNVDDLNPMQKLLVNVPGGQFLLPDNKPQFAGRVFAYAQQMNALDRYMEEGKSLEYAKKYVPIDFDDSVILKESPDFGTKQNWLEETKEWMKFLGEAKDVGGSPYVLEMINQVKRGQPVNINTKYWLTVQSAMAEGSEEVAELMQQGFSKAEATRLFYEWKGIPIVKPNAEGEINWTSIQKPNEIDIWSGRRFIYTPALAEEYEKNRQYNINEIMGTKVPFSHGRYQAGLRYEVGSDQYNTMSGWIDGTLRILSELGFYKAVNTLKKANKLSKTRNVLTEFDKEELFSPVKKKNIIQDWVKKNKANPVTGKHIDNVDEFLETFTDYQAKMTKPLRKQIKQARNKTSSLRKEWGLIAGWTPRMFAKTGDDLVDIMDSSGDLDRWVENKSSMALLQDSFTRNFPEKIHEIMINIDNKESMKKLFQRIYGNGIRLNKMDEVFALSKLPKGRSYLTQNVARNMTGKDVVIPSLGSMAGRAINTALRTTDEAWQNINRRYKSSNINMSKTKLTDDSKVITKDDYRLWEQTGEMAVGRGLGFYSELTQGMSPWWKKRFAIQPQTSISYTNRNDAYRTIVNHMVSTGYATRTADLLLKEFYNMKHTINNVNDFAQKLFIQDIGMVGRRRGIEKVKILQRYVEKKFKKEGRIANYFSDPKGNMMPDNWTARRVNPDSGQIDFIPSLTKISDAANQGAPLTNNRALNRIMSEIFDITEELTEGGVFRKANEKIKNFNKDGKANFRIQTSGAEGGSLDFVLGFWMNDLLKPFLITKPALTSRVLLEEQLFFAVFPQLYGALSLTPNRYFGWLHSYGYMPKRSPIRKFTEWLIDSGEDIDEIMQSQYYYDAINAQFAIDGFSTASINKNMINYLPISPENPLAIDGYIFQYVHLFNDDIIRALARIENGDPSKIIAWSKTPEALKLREKLIAKSGQQYIANKVIDIRKQDNWLKYLFARENEIRMRTGMPMKEGNHYFYIDEGINAGEAMHDISYPYLGSAELRKGLATGRFTDINGNVVQLGNRWEDFGTFNPYEKSKPMNQKKLKEAIEGFIGLTDEVTGNKIYDFGYAITPSKLAQSRVQDFVDNLNDVYGNWFETLLQSPTARLNRGPIFKQYRWLLLSGNFHKFTKKLQAKFIAEAEAANIPGYMLDDIKGTALLKSGNQNNYESWSNFANSFAVQNMKDILYDTKNRHRISEVTRNIFPFPEVFIEMGKRWAKGAIENPYTLRAVNNASQGLESIGGTYSYYGQGRWEEDPLTGETVFVYPWQPMHSDLAFGDDTRFRATATGFAGGVNMVSTQGFPASQPMMQFAMNKLFDSKFGQMIGFNQEFQDEFFGNFPPPESFGEAFKFWDIPWIQKLAAAGNPGNILWEKMNDTYVDPDNNFLYWDMDNKLNSMRAETTIEFWENAKITGQDRIWLEEGKLDKYIRHLMPNWDGVRAVKSTEELQQWFLENQNKPYEYAEGELSMKFLDEALMMYSAHEARWFALARGLTQFSQVTSFVLRSSVQDKSGKWWSTAVLAKEYDDLVQKYGGNHRMAAEEFGVRFGLDHGYILTSTKDKSPEAAVFSQELKIWKDEHKDEIIQLPLTYHMLNQENPEAERTYADMIWQATLNPNDYLLSANDTVAWFKYDQFKKQTEQQVINEEISAAEKEYLDKAFRLALTESHPGFQASYGQTEPAKVQDRFKEMRDRWTTLDFPKEYEAGRGFNEFYEYWLEAEEASRELSKSNSSTWWLTSNSEEAFLWRKRISDAAFMVIAEYPDFMPIYQNVIIRMFSGDRDILEYNSYLGQQRQRFGDS